MKLNKTYQKILFVLVFVASICSAEPPVQQDQISSEATITVTGDQPVLASDGEYETIELASLPATLPGHQRGPVDPGSWLDEDHLTGNWNGLRSQLSDQGIAIESSLVTDWSKALKGGENTHGETFRHLFDFNMTFDLEKLWGWQGTTVFVDFYNQNGPDGSEEAGDIQAYSNLDAPDRTQLAEVWIQQVLIKELLEIKFGKMDTNADFAYVDNGGEFINSSAGFSPTIALPTYPETAVGVVLFSSPADNLYANFGVYDGAAQEGITTGTRGFSTAFDSSPSDLFLIGEAAITWEENDLPARVGVGAWRHTGSFEQFDGDMESGTEGVYLVCDKAIRKENPDDHEDEQGSSLFLQYGLADQDVMEIEQHFGVGIQCIGGLPGRDEDITGLMASWVDLSDKAGAGFTENNELSIELFHRIQLTSFFSIKPDVQYIVNPGGSGTSDAIVATLRTELVF